VGVQTGRDSPSGQGLKGGTRLDGVQGLAPFLAPSGGLGRVQGFPCRTHHRR